MPSLTLVMGIPAAGKTTHARHLAETTGAELLSTDLLRRDRSLDRGAFLRGVDIAGADILAQGRSVIVDSCASRWRERSGWLGIARGYCAGATLVIMHCPLSIAIQRNSLRAFPVPENMIKLYHRRMIIELPKIIHEGWDSILHNANVNSEW